MQAWFRIGLMFNCCNECYCCREFEYTLKLIKTPVHFQPVILGLPFNYICFLPEIALLLSTLYQSCTKSVFCSLFLHYLSTIPPLISGETVFMQYKNSVNDIALVRTCYEEGNAKVFRDHVNKLHFQEFIQKFYG